MSEQAPLPVEERPIMDVHNINNLRRPDGSHDPFVLDEIYKNLVSAVKEGGIPNAVHEVEHEYHPTGEFDESGQPINAFMWLGRTALYNAQTGHRFHVHRAAHERVNVEEDEARYNQPIGVTKILVSPKMSKKDAPYKVAKQEHLADDDAVRITNIVTDSDGNIRKRVMQSALVRDVPLQAWVAMLEDPDNIFGKSIQVEDPESALSIMKEHRQLEVPVGTLEHGVVSIIEAVSEYIDDPLDRLSVQAQIERYKEDQLDIDAKAQNIAKRWLAFEKELADSLYTGEATYEVERFIATLDDQWNDDQRAIINAHRIADTPFYSMTNELAVLVEEAKQNILWTRAGIITNNEQVIEQIDSERAESLRQSEAEIQMAYASGMEADVRAMEASGDRDIADSNVKVGGGCSGSNIPKFKDGKGGGAAGEDSDNRENWKKKIAKCVIKLCPSRPRAVTVGPCGVCMDRCQRMYDRGEDPVKEERTRRPAQNQLAPPENTVRTPELPRIARKRGEPLGIERSPLVRRGAQIGETALRPHTTMSGESSHQNKQLNHAPAAVAVA